MKKNHRIPFIVLFIISLGAPALIRASEPLRGQSDGAPYALWLPKAEGPVGKILVVLAPGYRPPEASRVARLDITDADLVARHEAGWTIAATAYRKNGWAVSEGVRDIVSLVAKLDAEHGPYRLRFVVGESMGGLIVARLMEDPVHGPIFSGGLALGAALGVEPGRLAELGGDAADLELTHRPLRPLVFVSNRNELAGPLAYFAEVAASAPERLAAVHIVDRPGHVNLTAEERRRALETVYNWSSGEPPSLLGDATVAVLAIPSVGEIVGEKLHGKVTRVDPDFGNLDIGGTFSDLRALGVDYGSTVAISNEAGLIVNAVVGDRYAAVPRGAWVLVILPDGGLRLAINMGHAGEGLSASMGSALSLARVAEVR